MTFSDPGSRLARWRLKLEEYNYTIEHKPGKINKNAEVLLWMKINNFQQVANLETKITLFASNKLDDEQEILINTKFYRDITKISSWRKNFQ